MNLSSGTLTSHSLTWRRSTLPIPASGYSSICLREPRRDIPSLRWRASLRILRKGRLRGGKCPARELGSCPPRTVQCNPVRLKFDRNIDSGLRLEITLVRMTCNAPGGFQSTALTTSSPQISYSLAVHVIDLNSGVRVAQGDVGVGPGTFVRLAQRNRHQRRCRPATTS